jgi:hypothetical protein
MKMNRIVRAALAASLLCATAGASTLLGTGSAQAAGDKVSSAVAKPLADAVAAVQTKDYATALAKIKEAQAVADRTPFDDYRINQVLVIVAFNLKDTATATTASEAAADSPAMPDADKPEIYRNALVLSSAANHYQKAVTYGLALAALRPLTADEDANIAVDYYNLKDMAHAKEYAQKNIDAAKAAGTPPDANSQRIILNAQAGQHDEAGAEQTLESLVLTDPDNSADSWRQLVDVSLSTKGLKDIDALYLLRLQIFAGAMSASDDYTALAGVAEQLGYPTEAVNVLQKGIASGKLSNAQASELMGKGRKDAAQDERALSSYAAAAEKSKTGEQDVKLGEDYWGYGRYADAEAAARRGIAKGGLKDPGEGPLLLGAALVAQGKYDDAVQTLAQVNQTPAKTKAAHLWSLYAQGKQKKAPAAPAPAAAPAH